MEAAAEARWDPGSHAHNYRLTEVELIATELAHFRAAGGSTIVDQTPPVLGRDLPVVMENRYRDPAETGHDRLAAAAARARTMERLIRPVSPSAGSPAAGGGCGPGVASSRPTRPDTRP